MIFKKIYPLIHRLDLDNKAKLNMLLLLPKMISSGPHAWNPQARAQQWKLNNLTKPKGLNNLWSNLEGLNPDSQILSRSNYEKSRLSSNSTRIWKYISKVTCWCQKLLTRLIKSNNDLALRQVHVRTWCTESKLPICRIRG